MFAIERKSKIIDLVERAGTMKVAELSRILDVVPETIRRDLKELQQQGVLVKVHGGAALAAPRDSEYPVGVRELKYAAEKNALCHAAAQYLEDGDVIFIDNSSTLLCFLQHVDPALTLTVVTNSIRLLEITHTLPTNNITLICSGGIYNKTNRSLYGSASMTFVNNFVPTKSFVSCHGLSLTHGFTDGSLHESEFKRELMNMSLKRFFLVDHSKIGKIGPVKLSPIGDCNVLITDQPLEDAVRQQLQSQNQNLELVISGS